MDIFDLSAIIRLDSSQYERGLDEAQEKTNNFGQFIKGGLGTAVKIGAAAFTAAGAAMVAFGKSSVETGVEFDKSMSQVAATMGKTVDEVQDLRDFAMEMGSKTAFSAVQAADALNYMALAGYDAEKSMNMLPNVLNLAAAGGMDLARASDMITDAESALGLNTKEVTVMVDQMAKTASSSNTSVEQLGDAILTIGGTAKFMAGGTDRLNVALGILADNGIKGSEAGTKLRNMILKLSSPTEKGAKLIKKMGLDIYDSNGKMRDFQDIITDLNEAMSDMTDEEKVQAISELFNARDIDAVQALLGTTTERWNELGEAIVDSDRAAEKMANTQLDNLAGDITLFQSALEGAKILISDSLTPSLRGFVQFGTNSITKLSDAFKEGGLSGAVEAVSGIVTNGLNMIMSGLPQFVSAGAQLVVSIASGIFESLPTVFSSGLEIINSVTNGIKENLSGLIPTAMEALVQFSGSLRENVGLLVDSGLEMIMAIANSLIENLPVFIETVPEIVTNIAGIINDNAPKLLVCGITIIGNLIQGIISAVPTLIAEFPNILLAIANVITAFNWIGLGTGIITAIKNGVVSLAAELPNALQNISNTAWNAVKSINWLSLGSDIINFIVKGIMSLASSIPSALLSIGQSAIKSIASINWISVGINIVSGIASGITSAAGSVIDAIGGVVSGAIGGAKKLLGISSPSKVFRDQVGKMIAEGMALGISEGTPLVTDAMDEMNEDVFDIIPDVEYDKGVVVNKIGTDSDSGNGAVVAALQALTDAIYTLDDKLQEKMEEALETMHFDLNGREFGRLVRDVTI